MTPRASLCLLVLALAAPTVRADTTYVIEQLVVGVSSTSDPESERVGQVKSGDKLEVIERDGDQVHVKLSNGKDGWIKSSYLTSDPPLQTRLTERTAEVEKVKQEGDKLKQEGDKLRQEGDRLKQDVSRLESELAAAKAAHSATSDSPPAPAPIHDTVFLRDPERQSATSWPVLLAVAAVMLFLGFIAGWKTLDRRIRHKYGGLKIY
jgi:hypothetical protein